MVWWSVYPVTHVQKHAAANADSANDTQESSKPGNDSGLAAETATITRNTGETPNGETGET
jgi:hypothetical protein